MVMDSRDIPPGWKQMQLGDLLPQKDLEKFVRIMNRIRTKKVDDIVGRKEIMALLEPLREELEKKGVLADYLSYVLLAKALQGEGGELGRATLA